MKHFYSVAICSVAVFSIVSFAPITHAATCTGPSDQASCGAGNVCQQDVNGFYACVPASSAGTPSGSCTGPSDSSCGAGNSCQQDANGFYACFSNAGSALTNANAPSGTNNTNNNTPSGGGGNPVDAFGPIFGVIMELFAWLMGVAGIVLNDVIYYTVVQMGSYVNGLSALGVTWRILRDIGNIVLIFGFLAVGIATILGIESYGISKRIPTLIIVAILLNFSLFISEAVIDVGNFVATQFYTQIVGGQISTQTDPGANGISNAIMDTLGLQTLYNLNPKNADNTPQTQGWISEFNSTTMFTAFLAIILFIVGAFVLFSIAFTLVMRFVALLFLVIVAPIGFAGLLVPRLENTAKEWWSQLINQTITAPVLLLMLYIALAVITDAKFLTGFNATKSGYGGAMQGANAGQLASFAGIALAFLVAMGLLLACVVLAKRMGAFGASAATKWAGAASFGVVGFAGRRTIGRVSNRVAKSIRSSNLGRTEFGRTLAGAADRGAKGSFDFRGIGAVSGGLKQVGLDAGKAEKGGYKQIREDATKKRVEYAESLELTPAEAERKKKLEKDLEAAKEKQIRDLILLDKKGLAGDELKKEKERISNQYKAVERRVQYGEVDAAGKKVAKGLNDYKDLPLKEYVASLEKRSAPFSPGIIQDAVARGAAAGVAEGLGAAFVGAALGTAAVGGAAAGAALGTSYILGTAPGANKDAASKLKKKIKDTSLESLRKALAAGGGGGGGGGTKDEDEEEP